MNENRQKLTFGSVEYAKYTSDVSAIMTECINNVIANADKHNVDRDEALKNFSFFLSSCIEISTFKDYNLEGVNK